MMVTEPEINPSFGSVLIVTQEMNVGASVAIRTQVFREYAFILNLRNRLVKFLPMGVASH